MTISSITVVVCTANRASDLTFMLQEFAKVKIPPRTSVDLLIIDNASTDSTRSVVEEASKYLQLPVHYAYEPRKRLGYARNCGVARATGEIIAWTDDDCVVSEDWLIRIAAHFESKDAPDLLGGRIELFDKTHYPIPVKTSGVIGKMDRLSFPGGVLLSCNMAFHRRLIDRVGDFDARFGAGAPLRGGEDADFVYRAYNAGCKVEYFPDVVVYHYHKRVTRGQVARSRRGYAFSDGAFLRKHIFVGDDHAFKWLYWRVAHSVTKIFERPLTRNTLIEASMLVSMLRGSLALVQRLIAGSIGQPFLTRRGLADPKISSPAILAVGTHERGLAPDLAQKQGSAPCAPSISVIIPAYNAEQTLANAIRSALAQTYQATEIIVVDDGSSDRTADIALDIGPKVRLLQQANSGCGEARNTGARAASGEWLAFLDADDSWLPNKLEKQLPYTADARVAVVNCRRNNKLGHAMGDEIRFDRLWQRNDLIVSSSLVRRTAFEAAGRFWSERYCEDYHLWLRLAGQGWTIANCPEDLIVYSPAPGSLSQQTERFAAAEVACIEDIAVKLGLPTNRLRQRLIAAYLGHAGGAIHNRNLALARTFVRKSLEFGISSQQFWILAAASTPAALLDLRRTWIARHAR